MLATEIHPDHAAESLLWQHYQAVLDSDECAIGVFLLFCLASIVHHSDKLKAVVATERPGHSFATIPILNNIELLAELKKLVTLEPAGDVQRPSGIPPHVRQSKKLRKALEELKVINTKVDSLKDTADMFQPMHIQTGMIGPAIVYTVERDICCRMNVFSCCM